MITLFQQLDRYRVERFKQLRDRTWAWVTVGEFNAVTWIAEGSIWIKPQKIIA